jgi:hypothetical protein
MLNEIHIPDIFEMVNMKLFNIRFRSKEMSLNVSKQLNAKELL